MIEDFARQWTSADARNSRFKRREVCPTFEPGWHDCFESETVRTEGPFLCLFV